MNFLSFAAYLLKAFSFVKKTIQR